MSTRPVIVALLLLLTVHSAAIAGPASIYQTNMDPLAVDELGYNDMGSPQRIAQRFALTAPVSIGQVEFLGGYYPGNSSPHDAFTISLYSDAGGVPDVDSLVAQIVPTNLDRTATGATFIAQIFKYAAQFDPVVLAAATPYWITIVNDTSLDPENEWVWVGQKGGGDGAILHDPSIPWQGIPYQYAFSLVPEPGTVSVFALVGLMLFRRYRQFLGGTQ